MASDRQLYDLHAEPFTPIEPDDAAGGGLYGTYPNPNVGKVRNVAITAGDPSVGAVLTATSTTSAAWLPPVEGINSFTNLTALAAFNDASLETGTIVYVSTLRDYFQKVVGETPAGSTVTELPTHSGDGGWFRLFVASPTWAYENFTTATQADWYVDATNGNDEYAGTQANPLKTLAELGRRFAILQRFPSATPNYVINLLSAIPATDTFILNFRTIGTGRRPAIILLGQKTATRTSTITSDSVVSDPTTGTSGTQANITDTTRTGGAAWADGEIVYFTSTGYGCHVMRDMTGGNARVSQLFTPGSSNISANARVTNAQRPLTGAEYQTVTFTSVACDMSVTGDGQFVARYCDFNTSVLVYFSVSSVFIKECRIRTSSISSSTFGATSFQSYANIYDATLNTITINSSVLFTVYALSSFIKCTAQSTRGVSNCTFDGCTFQGIANAGGKLTLSGSTTRVLLSGINAFYDWGTAATGGYAILISSGSILLMNGNPDAANPTNYLMGYGDASRDGAYGVFIIDGGQLQLPPPLNANYNPRLTGRTYDIYIDGLTGNDGAITSVVPIPTPGNPITYPTLSKAINGANGAGWTAWQTTFGRRLRSQVTGAQIIAGANYG